MQNVSVKELRRVSLLGRLAEALIATDSVSEFFQFLREKLIELIPAEHVFIYYHDVKSKGFVLLPEFNAPEFFSDGRKTRLDYSETGFQRFLKSRAAILRIRQPQDNPFTRQELALIGEDIQAELAIPISTQTGDLLGVLQLVRKNPIGFNKAQKAVAIAAAAFIANLLERDLLFTKNERLKAERSWWQNHFQYSFQHLLGPACLIEARSGLIQDVNSGMETLFGVPRQTLTGTPLDEYLMPESAEAFREVLKDGDLSQPVVLKLLKLRRKNQSPYYLHFKLLAVPNTSQILVRVFDAQKRIRRRRRQLHQWNKLNQFLRILQPGPQENLHEDIQKALQALGEATGARYVTLFKVKDGHLDLLNTINLVPGQRQQPDQALRAGLARGPYNELLSADSLVFYPDLLEKEPFSRWRPIAKQLGFSSFLALPLDLQNNRIGLLCLYFQDKQKLPLQERVLIEACGRYMAMILSHLRLQRKSQERFDQIKIIEELTKSINASKSIDEIIKEAARGIQKIIPFDLMDITLFDSEGENVKLYSIFSRHLGEKIGVETWRGFENLPEYGWLCLGEAVDPELHAKIEGHLEAKRNVLLMASERYLGTLEIASMDERTFKREHLDFLNQVAGQLATAFENIRLFEKLSNRVREMSAIAKASWAVASEIDTQAMLVSVLQNIQRALDARSLQFRLLVPIPDIPMALDEGEPQEPIDWDEFPDVLERLTGQRQYCILGRRGDALYLSRNFTGKFLLVPVVVQQKAIGWILVELPEVRKLARREVEMVRTMTNLIASALESERLRRITSERTEQLEQVNEELEKFVYTVSHDLKSPIVSIHGFSTLLLEDYGNQLDADARHYLERIQKNALAMQQLVKDLLELSRVGRGVLNFEKINAKEIVERALLEYSYQVREEPIRFNIQERFPDIYADVTQMTQVFANLIGNAIKFRNPENEETVVEVGAEERSREIVFWVRDNGIGIAPEFHERIFNLFERHPHSKKVEGSGIGLTVVKRIVELHKGKIWVESEAGAGATFYFTLPNPKAKAHPPLNGVKKA